MTSWTSEFALDLTFSNQLPELPLKPKLLAIPFHKEKLGSYKQTKIEKNYKFPLLVEPDLGLNVNLVDRNAYRVNSMELALTLQSVNSIQKMRLCFQAVSETRVLARFGGRRRP